MTSFFMSLGIPGNKHGRGGFLKNNFKQDCTVKIKSNVQQYQLNNLLSSLHMFWAYTCFDRIYEVCHAWVLLHKYMDEIDDNRNHFKSIQSLLFVWADFQRSWSGFERKIIPYV